MQNRSALLLLFLFAASATWCQSVAPKAQSPMPGMDMSDHDTPGMKDSAQPDRESEKEGEAGAGAMHSMEGHMDMGPHMKMTELRPAKPGDAERARAVAESARKAAEKYLDYQVALNDGFRIFHPELPQKIYHFTNYAYGFEAAMHFNPDHPTSLLYEKHGEDYKLIGVMYTAPKRFTEEELDERIPLSIAQWHEHVNFCTAPMGRKFEYFQPHPRFGFRGSISTKEACDAAGGTFHPVVFNWMVHVYPFEKDSASVWSVSRQHDGTD